MLPLILTLWNLQVQTDLSTIKDSHGRSPSPEGFTMAPRGDETTALQNTIVPGREINDISQTSHYLYNQLKHQTLFVQ